MYELWVCGNSGLVLNGGSFYGYTREYKLVSITDDIKIITENTKMEYLQSKTSDPHKAQAAAQMGLFLIVARIAEAMAFSMDLGDMT